MAPGHTELEQRPSPAPGAEAPLRGTPAPAKGAHRLARALLRRTLPACAVQTPPSAAPSSCARLVYGIVCLATGGADADLPAHTA